MAALLPACLRKTRVPCAAIFLLATVAIAGGCGSAHDDFSYRSGYEFGRAGRANYIVEGSAEEIRLDAFRRCLAYQMHAKSSSDGHRIDDEDFMDGCMHGFGIS